MINPKRAPSAKAQRRRADIMEAALEQFATQGFVGASIRDIAKALGINEAAIYYYFPSKDALYASVMTEHIFRPDLLDIEVAADPSDWLKAIGVRYLEHMTAKRRVTALKIAEAFKPRDAQHISVATYRADYEDRRKSVAKRLKGAGVPDHDAVASLFFASLFGAWSLEMDFGEQPWGRDRTKALVDRLVDRLITPR